MFRRLAVFAGSMALEAVEQGKRKNPHFDLASFGSRFQDPALQRRVEESLRKAGLN